MSDRRKKVTNGYVDNSKADAQALGDLPDPATFFLCADGDSKAGALPDGSPYVVCTSGAHGINWGGSTRAGAAGSNYDTANRGGIFHVYLTPKAGMAPGVKYGAVLLNNSANAGAAKAQSSILIKSITQGTQSVKMN